MRGVLQRLLKLEAAAKLSNPITILWQDDGESEEACRKRHGYPPDARGTVVIVMDEVDAKA